MRRIRLTSVLILLFSFHALPAICQVWEFVYEQQHSMGREVVSANDQGFVITGTNSEFDDGITIKIDPEGELVWASPYGGFAMTKTCDGYLIATNIDYDDGVFRKLDEAGNLMWTHYFSGINSLSIASVITTSDSCFAACGRASIDPHRSIFIMKTELDGDIIWTRNFFSDEFGTASDILEYDGHYYITGRFDDPELIYYQALIKVTSDGDIIWQKTYPFGWGGYSIALTHDTCLIVAGRELLVKFNLDGDTIWKRTFAPGLIYSIDLLSDHGFIVSGNKEVSNVMKNLVARLDSTGNIIWWKIYPIGINQDMACFESIISTPGDGFVTCGYSDYDTAYLIRAIRGDIDGSIYVGADDMTATNAEITIFPNPFNGTFTIDASDLIKAEVYNASGSLVGVFFEDEIDLSRQPAGIYFARIETVKGFVIRKVIKK